MEHDIAIDIDGESPTLEEDLGNALVEVRRFPLVLNHQDVQDALEDAGLPKGSLLATLLRKTDGLLVDGGWVRIFGLTDQACGRSLAGWNADESWRGTWGDGLAGKLCFADDPAGNQFAINMGPDGTGNWKVYHGLVETRTWKSLDKTFGQWLVDVLAGRHEIWYHPEEFRQMKSLETVKPVGPKQAWRREPGSRWVPGAVTVRPVAEVVRGGAAEDAAAEEDASAEEATAAMMSLVEESGEAPAESKEEA